MSDATIYRLLDLHSSMGESDVLNEIYNCAYIIIDFNSNKLC